MFGYKHGGYAITAFYDSERLFDDANETYEKFVKTFGRINQI